MLREKTCRPRWTPLSTCFLPETPVSYDNTLHPYSAYCCKSLAPRDSSLFSSQFLYPGLFPSRASYWWVPTGHDCPHRRGVQGLRWLPYVTAVALDFRELFFSVTHLLFCLPPVHGPTVKGESRAPLRLDRVKLDAH